MHMHLHACVCVCVELAIVGTRKNGFAAHVYMQIVLNWLLYQSLHLVQTIVRCPFMDLPPTLGTGT